MRVALLTPYFSESARGNAVTVSRISRYLDLAGCTTRVFSLDEHPPDELPRLVTDFGPDIVHAFHAIRCGGIAKAAAALIQVPYLLTLTGTDVYRSESKGYSTAELAFFCGAGGITAFSDIVAGRFSAEARCPAAKIVVIPQGVEPYPKQPDAAEQENFIFLLPAGVRPVKNVLFPLPLLAELHRSDPRILFQVVGPIIDAAYGAEVLAHLAEEPSASWLGAVEPSGMPAVYGRAAVVLNCSISEGGMANSLLEAMAIGRPVLAADIEGNRSLVTDGVNGLLYADAQVFSRKARMLTENRNLREELVANAREFVRDNCSPEVEAASYKSLYQLLLCRGVSLD